MDSERRNDQRFRQYFEVNYIIRNVYGSDSIVTALTLDISATGMRMGTTRRLPKSQRFVECRITMGPNVVRVLVEIMWRTETSMGVRFINPPVLLKAEIARMQKRQRPMVQDHPPIEKPKQATSATPAPPPPRIEPPGLSISRILQEADLPSLPPQPPAPEPYQSLDLQKKWLNKSKPKGDLHRKWLDRRGYISDDDFE